MYRHIALVTVTASLPSATQPNQALFDKLQRHFKIELDVVVQATDSAACKPICKAPVPG
jgi:hypothetical protein